MAVNGYTYDGKSKGNILVLGQTACGKTTFNQKLGKYKLFGNIKDVIWLTKIVLSKQREDNIRSSFDVPVNFCYLQNVSEFDDLIESFQRKKYNVEDDNIIGENNIFDRVIVMDNVSGLADKSNEFGNFLTVTRKFNFTVVYVFHTMYPSKQNWQLIISQTKIFNIFPGSILVSVISKILTTNCKRYTYQYIPTRELWLNRLYFDISNSNKKECLTIDCRDFNSIGPSKSRTNTEDGQRQICHYNRNKKDKSSNRFLALRKQNAGENIIFEIKNIIEEANVGNFDYYELTNERSEFENGRSDDNRGNIKRPISKPMSTDDSTRRIVRKKSRFLA